MSKSGAQLKKTVFMLALAACAQSSCLAAEERGLSEVKAVPRLTISAVDKRRLDKGQVLTSIVEKPNKHRWVTARIEIKAEPKVVWEMVHEERKHDPDMAYSKVISAENNTFTIEQKFVLLPVIGTSVCVMKQHEIPLERIDYSLISSDRFKAMEGSWVLSPGDDGKTTILELSSYIDIGFPVPRSILEGITGKKLERRLSNVKNQSESAQANIARKSEENTVL